MDSKPVAASTPGTRVERDSMGEMEVPADALYGASTQRAVLNFPISGQRMPRRFLRSLALVKLAAAETNQGLGLLDAAKAQAIAAAAREVADGREPPNDPKGFRMRGFCCVLPKDTENWADAVADALDARPETFTLSV